MVPEFFKGCVLDVGVTKALRLEEFLYGSSYFLKHLVRDLFLEADVLEFDAGLDAHRKHEHRGLGVLVSAAEAEHAQHLIEAAEFGELASQADHKALLLSLRRVTELRRVPNAGCLLAQEAIATLAKAHAFMNHIVQLIPARGNRRLHVHGEEAVVLLAHADQLNRVLVAQIQPLDTELEHFSGKLKYLLRIALRRLIDQRDK